MTAENRLECLRLATTLTGLNQAQVVTAAQNFFNFVSGGPANAPASLEEAIKPARKVKESAEEKKAESTPPAGDMYNKVREITLKLRDDKGAAAVKSILSSFTVGKITELKPEQYEKYIKACETRLGAPASPVGAGEDELGV